MKVTIETTVKGLPFTAAETVQAIVDALPPKGWNVTSFSADTAGTLPRTMPVRLVLEGIDGSLSQADAEHAVESAIAEHSGWLLSWGQLASSLGTEVVAPTLQEAAKQVSKASLSGLQVGIALAVVLTVGYGLLVVHQMRRPV